MHHSLVHISIAFLVLTGLIFLNTLGVLDKILDSGRIGISILSFPLVKVFSKAKVWGEFVGHLKRLATENQILTKQVEELSVDVAVLEKAKQENRLLREALGFQVGNQQVLIPSEVIAWDPLNIDPKVTLNRGKRQGVEVGAAVVVAKGILVGVVTSVFDNTSQVELLTSSEIVVNAEAVPGGATGIVRGDHGLGLVFDLVSQTEVVKPGDKLVTSGLGGQFPKNLLIGEIGKILSSESELFQKTSVIPATNLRGLRIVFISKRSD